MTALTVRNAIATRLDTIAGLVVLTGQPDTIHNPPLAYIFYGGDDDEWLSGNPPTIFHNWRWVVRVCVDLQDPVISENKLIPFANSVHAALVSDLQLTATAHIVKRDRITQSAEGEDGYPTIGEKQYRAITFRFTTKETP